MWIDVLDPSWSSIFPSPIWNFWNKHRTLWSQVGRSPPCSLDTKLRLMQESKCTTKITLLYNVFTFFFFLEYVGTKPKRCYLNQHSQKIRQTLAHKHWTALSTLLGLISSVDRDLSWNNCPVFPYVAHKCLPDFLAMVIQVTI